MITKVTGENLEAFLDSSEFAILLADATWNAHKELAEQFRRIAEEAETAEGVGSFAFGELDLDDAGLWEFLKKYQVLNVPAILYIWQGNPIKTVIGTQQNIKEQVRYMFEDVTNGWF